MDQGYNIVFASQLAALYTKEDMISAERAFFLINLFFLKYNTNSDEAQKLNMWSLGKFYIHKGKREKSKQHSQIFTGPLLKAILTVIIGMRMHPAASRGQKSRRAWNVLHCGPFTTQKGYLFCILKDQ